SSPPAASTPSRGSCRARARRPPTSTTRGSPTPSSTPPASRGRMPADVIMPALGMAQETGKVLRWLKQDGEPVTKGEPLLEVETDKVTVEIEAPADGTLAGVSAPDGADVPVGTVSAVVLAEGEAVAPAPDPEPQLEREVEALAAAPVAVATAAAPDRPRGRVASPEGRRLRAA